MIPIIEVESILISSTGETLLVDTSTGAIAARIVGGDGTGITSKSETDGSKSLDVNVRSGIVQVRLSGENTVYETTSTGVDLTNGYYQTIYTETSDTGKIIWTRFVFSNNDVDIKVTIDSQATPMINGLNLNDLYKNYKLDVLAGQLGNTFIRTENQGKVLVLEFPGGLEYTTSFVIQARANQTNIELERGMIIRALE